MHNMQKMLSVCVVILSVLAVFPPVTASGSSGNTYFDLGVFAYEGGKYEEALGNFNQALATGADKGLVYHYLGKTYLAMEKYDDASYYLDWASKMNPELPGLTYDRAMLSYRLSQYAAAGELFMKVVDREPANVLARYYAGICLFKQEQYNDALPFFIAAGEQSPTLKGSCSYYAGICYAKVGDSPRALAQFRNVSAATDDELLKKYAASWLELYEAREKAKVEKPYELYGKVGVQYDSNVVLEPVNADIYANDDDFAIVGYFSGTYDLLAKDAWRGGVGYTHYQTGYSRLSEYAVIGSIGQMYVNYRAHPFTFSLSYLPQYYWVDADSFLMRHQIRPEILWNVNDRVITRLTASHYKNNHFEDNGRDGNTVEASFDAFYRLGEQGSYLLGGIAYEKENAENNNYDYGEYRLKLGITMVFPSDVQVSAVAKYFKKMYDNEDTLFGVKREDNRYQGSFSVEKKLCYDWLFVAGDFSLTKNESNIDNFTYKRNVTTLSLVARY